jgi:hypothetical protein
MPLPVLVIAQTAQTCLLLLLLSWLGLRLGQFIGLDSPFARALVYGLKQPSVSRRALIIASLTGAVGGLVILPLDRLFQPFMPPTTQPIGGNIELWKRLLASFYGGITEELLLRLFLMTLIAWIIWELGEKNPIVDLSLFKSRNFTLGTSSPAPTSTPADSLASNLIV